MEKDKINIEQEKRRTAKSAKIQEIIKEKEKELNALKTRIYYE